MSKLGKIYEINIRKNDKIVYPIIYENKSFIYCKRYGTDHLDYYPKNSVYTYEVFKEGYEKGEVNESQTYKVYVPAHIQTFFEWIKEKDPRRLEIERLRRQIKDINRNIHSYNNEIRRMQDIRSMSQREIEVYEDKIAELYAELCEESASHE